MIIQFISIIVIIFMAGKKKKEIVKTKLPISREDIKEIKDEIKF